MKKTPNPNFRTVDSTSQESLRTYWLRWLAYLCRPWDENPYDEWMILLDPLYKQWAHQVLRAEQHYLEGTASYFTRAIEAASLQQLQQLIAVRYEEAHPVRDGWTQAFRATLCASCPRHVFTPIRLAA